LVLAGFLNVDSIVLAEHLWKEPTLRHALVVNANKIYRGQPGITQKPGRRLARRRRYIFQFTICGTECSIGWKYTNMKLGRPIMQPDPIGENVIWVCTLKCLNPNWKTTMGRKFNRKRNLNGSNCSRMPEDQRFSRYGRRYRYETTRIVLSAGAAAQGAPFWFDILKKLVNIRGSGVNSDEKEK